MSDTPIINELARLRQLVQGNADFQQVNSEQGAHWTRVIDQAIQDIDRLTQHSELANTLAWRISEILGDLPEGATVHHGDPGKDLERLGARLDALTSSNAELELEVQIVSRLANRTAEKLGKAAEALVWCSGSEDFAYGGMAREGWLKGPAEVLADYFGGEVPPA